MKPGELGFTMPAEWEPHAGCWMGWPKRLELWQEYLEAARDDYVRVAQAIARFEPLTMVAEADCVADAQSRCGPSVRVIALPMDDSWLRDSGPTFVVDRNGKRAAASVHLQCLGRQVSASR